MHKFKNHKGDEYYVIVQKTVSLNGIDCNGVCDAPADEGAILRLQEDLKDKELFIVILHEMVHAFFYEESEKAAERFANASYKLLRKFGFKFDSKKA